MSNLASIASAKRYGGSVLNNAVQKAYAARVAAGLIKPQEEQERKSVMLISTKGGRLVEADALPPEQTAKPRKEPKRRLIGIMPKETQHKGNIYPKLSWIVEATARYFDLSKDELTGPSRAYKFCIPRQIAMYLCRELTIRSTIRIGAALGERDHTTVMHGVAAIKRRMAEDSDLATKVGILRKIILNGMYVGGNDNGGAR